MLRALGRHKGRQKKKTEALSASGIVTLLRDGLSGPLSATLWPTVLLAWLVMGSPLAASSTGGGLYMWGSNQHGQLARRGGDAASPVRSQGAGDWDGLRFVELALGGGHSVARDADGNVWAWGWNAKGQLGTQPVEEHGGCERSCRPARVAGLPVCTRIAAGHESSFAISASGDLFAFGSLSGGAALKGSATSIREAHKLSDDLDAALDGALQDDGVHRVGMRARRRFVDVDAGVFHAAAVTEDGDCVCWGKHGADTATLEAQQHDGQDVIVARQTNGVLVWKPSDGAKILEVACGWRHTVARDERGRVWGFGDNRRGQLLPASGPDAPASGCVGGPSLCRQDRVAVPRLLRVFGDNSDALAVKIDAGWSHTLVMSHGGRLVSFGRSDMGQCAPFEGVWDDACAGSEMVLARRGTSIFAAGWNEHGNLGIGPELGLGHQFVPQPVAVSLASAVDLVMAAGGGHSGLFSVSGVAQ